MSLVGYCVVIIVNIVLYEHGHFYLNFCSSFFYREFNFMANSGGKK